MPASSRRRSPRTMPLSLLDTRAQRVAIEGYEPRRGEDLAFMSNTVGPDYFRTLRIAAAWPDGSSRTATTTTAAPVGDRQRHAGAALLGRRRATPSASGSGSPTATGGRVVGVAADVKYSRINEAPRPVRLPAVPAVVPLEHDPAHARRRRPSTRWSTRRARASRRSTPTCRSCTARPLTEQIARRADLLSTWPRRCCSSSAPPGMALAAHGHLRPGVVHRQAEHARDRHPHGARRVGPVGRARGSSAAGLRLGAIGAALGIVAALGVGRLLGQRALRRQRDRRRVVRAGPGRRPRRGVAVATLVPAWRAARTNPLSALRHQ